MSVTELIDRLKPIADKYPNATLKDWHLDEITQVDMSEDSENKG